MKIHIGADHAGYNLKERLKGFLAEAGYEVVDHGAYDLNPMDDYPDFIEPVARIISENPEERGIILGGSGQGEAMDANRFPHVRAIEYYGGNSEIILLGREHNDANILSLGARFISDAEAEEAVTLFLGTAFSGKEHYVRRIEKMED
jgi:ribose 5-phosphate isomerase B